MIDLSSDDIEIRIKISKKAREILDEFKRNSGISTDDRLVEEAIFTIYETLTYAQTQNDGKQPISADRLLGMLSTFRRFSTTGSGYKY